MFYRQGICGHRIPAAGRKSVGVCLPPAPVVFVYPDEQGECPYNTGHQNRFLLMIKLSKTGDA